MSFSPQNRSKTVSGILLVAAFSAAASFLALTPMAQRYAISPLIIGIILGIVFANSLGHKIPIKWRSGVIFSTKYLLRAGIIFYGFRLTFQDILSVGVAGLIVSSSIVGLTFCLGYFVGVKILKLDRDTTILISAGSSICGAAAVLATEPVVKAAPHKTGIAIATVVIFGTIAMFLYPFLYQSGFLNISEQGMGIYLGGTLHEVAHVVGAGHAINQHVADIAVIVKMLRVMLLAPFLVVLSFWLAKTALQKGKKSSANKTKSAITIPWFAVGFILIVGFNSTAITPQQWISQINLVDTFLLTMAMTALGMETRLEKFKGIGLKPFYLATILFGWLLIGGYFITQWAISLSVA